MGLRLKNAIAVTSVFATIIVATYLLFTSVILREFDSIERERTALNMKRVFQTLDAVIDDLRGRTLDWARWDETYDFMRGKNRSYIETNVTYEAVAPFELVHIIFLSKEKKAIFAQEVVPAEETLRSIDPTVLSELTTHPAIASYLATSKSGPFSGIIPLNNEPLFISIAPITDNQGKETSNGFLIFTRAFSPALEEQIRERTQLDLSFTKLSGLEARDVPQTEGTMYRAEVATRGDTIHAIGTIYDSVGKPLISISHNAPRAIYQQGKAARDYMVSLIAICLVLANIILITFLNKTVIGRLERFASRIRTIASTKDFSLRVREDGHDEIGSVIGTFNALIRTTEATTTQLADARDEALRATQAKSSFVAHVSHELRTPIHSLSGLLRILFKGESSPTKRAYIQMAQDSAATLLATINNILDLSKVESGAIDLQHIPFSLRQTVRAAVRSVTPRVDEKPNLSFLFDIEPGVPDCFIGDPLRLQQVLVNLLANATKFTNEGGISLRVSPQTMDTERAYLLFQITDTGIGMTEEEVARIFKPYVQADDTIQTKYEGTGLGLSIVKTICDQLGGTVSASSIPNRGTTFTITVPLTRDQSAAESPQTHRPLHCVLIDDSPSFTSWMIEGLARYHCSVERVPPSDENALGRLVSGMYNPDLVLISPQASETPLVIEHLRELGERLTCPIITSLKASDMVAHERMQSLGRLTVTDAPTSPEEVLRLTRSTPVEPQVLGEKQSLDRRADSAPCRILVADDTPTSRLIIREMLEEAGYEVETVENGQLLVERLREDLEKHADCPITAVLTDIEMPIMGGVEAAAKIRELEVEIGGRTRIPIIAITAHALLEEHARFKQGGIDYVVTKPLRPADLDAALTALTSSKAIEQPSDLSESRQTVSIDLALRDLTGRLWEEVRATNARSATDNPSDGIDIIDVFERSGDSPRRTKLMLNAFLGSYHEPLTKLLKMSDGESTKELTLAAHSLKGMLLDVGAKHASHLAGMIERSLQRGDSATAERSRAVFTSETASIATLIERVVRHFPTSESM
jgi:signal transduction histidine kinase/CheY-like chemotaxis protein